MKYLRKFNESNSNEYYEQISDEEYESFIINPTFHPFSDSDISIINKIFDKAKKTYPNIKYKVNLSIDNRTKEIINQYIEINNTENIGITYGKFFSLKDEWYFGYIILDNRSVENYKCDQLDGLIKLLKDKKLI